MKDWKIYTLEWGNTGETKSAGEELGEFLKKLWPEDVKRKWVPRHVLSKEEVVKYIRKTDELDRKILAVYPEACNHHYTYGLCKGIADKRSSEYVYWHFDYHTDDNPPTSKVNDPLDYSILCDQSFVGPILQDTNAVDVKFEANKFSPIINSKGLEKKIIDTYLSIELDFMALSEIVLRYHEGTWKREDLLSKLNEILLKRNLISADCSGYFGHEDAKSLLLYACVCGRIIGKDTIKLERLHNLAREGKLDYDQMFKTLGLPPSKIKYESLLTLKDLTTFNEHDAKFGRPIQF